MIDSPTIPGWYRYEDGNNIFIFLLDLDLQWHVIECDGESSLCVWGYIEQALGTTNLIMMAALYP